VLSQADAGKAPQTAAAAALARPHRQRRAPGTTAAEALGHLGATA
jgi:hypothetical protein